MCTNSVGLILQFAMSQPITSKLALVASLMDSFVRSDNEALSVSYSTLSVQYRLLLDQVHHERAQLRLAQARIRELEFDLRSALDHNERLVEFNYVLEVSILDCASHPTVNPVARRLDFEDVIDLTTDEDIDLDEDDVEL